MTIAYLMADFPKPSETFVSREILTLQNLGLKLKPFAFQQPTCAQAQKLDLCTRTLIPTVEYLRDRSLVKEALSCKAIAQVWRQNSELERMTMTKSSPHLRVLRAIRLAKELTAAGIRHLH